MPVTQLAHATIWSCCASACRRCHPRPSDSLRSRWPTCRPIVERRRVWPSPGPRPSSRRRRSIKRVWPTCAHRKARVQDIRCSRSVLGSRCCSVTRMPSSMPFASETSPWASVSAPSTCGMGRWRLAILTATVKRICSWHHPPAFTSIATITAASKRSRGARESYRSVRPRPRSSATMTMTVMSTCS